jgi:hypothetical protein
MEGILEIDSAEARTALEEARRYNSRMKKALAAFGAAYHFIVWGGIWLIGFLITHFAFALPKAVSAWHWLVLNVLGNIISWSIGYRGRKAIKAGPHSGIMAISLLFLGFALAGALVARPAGDHEALMLVAPLIMLWLAVMGALTMRLLIWVSLGITALCLAAFFFLPAEFYLCLAISGGLPMIGLGIFLLTRRER